MVQNQLFSTENSCQLLKKAGSAEFSPQRVQRGGKTPRDKKQTLQDFRLKTNTFPVLGGMKEASASGAQMFQASLPLSRGCPSPPWSSEQVTEEVALPHRGKWKNTPGCSLYPGWSLEFKVSVPLFPLLGRQGYSGLLVE